MTEKTETKETEEVESMAKPVTGPEIVEQEGPSLDPQKEDPGVLESYGTFPVWMLKTIHNLTPDFLIEKSPAKKKFRI